MDGRAEIEVDTWDLVTWKANAKAAREYRKIFARAVSWRPSKRLAKNVENLAALLRDVQTIQGHPAFSPGVQRALLACADSLYGAIVEAAFPERNGNTLLPPKAILRAKYREALALLSLGPVLDKVKNDMRAGREPRTTWSNFSPERRQLAELWIETNIPLDADPRRVSAAVERCRHELVDLEAEHFKRPEDEEERARRKIKKGSHIRVPPARMAREMVGRLYGAEAATVKKNIGRKEKEKVDRSSRPKGGRKPYGIYR